MGLKHTPLSSIIISGMSVLIEKLKRASLDGPQAIGFRTGQIDSTRPRLPLVLGMSGENCDNLNAYGDSADAALISIYGKKADSKRISACYRAVSGIPWGGWLKADRGKRVELKGVDCDFIVFPLDTSPGIIGGAEAGKILAVDSSVVEGGLAGTVDKLPVDAVLLADEDDMSSLLTCRYLMLVHYFAALLTKPLMVSVPVEISSYEIGLLWEAGADGLLVMVDTAQGPDSIRGLRGMLDKAELPARRKQNASRPILPRFGKEESQESGEEEE